MRDQSTQKTAQRSVTIEEHNQALAGKDKTIAELSTKLDELKQNSLLLAADYKERIERLHTMIRNAAVDIQKQKDVVAETRRKYEDRIAKLNERHGAAVYKLRMSNEDLIEKLSGLLTTVEPAPEAEILKSEPEDVPQEVPEVAFEPPELSEN